MIRAAALLFVFALGGCATSDDKRWPSLAPRANEVSPLVPRVPLGACATCAPDASPDTNVVFTAPPPLLPAPEPLPLPEDAAARMAAIEAAIADVEGRWPEQRQKAQAAIAAASSANTTEAEVQASRYEALFLALGDASAALETLEDSLADQPQSASQEPSALAARAVAARLRLDQLEAVRAAGLQN
jgi:hypothetical protein